EMIFFKLKYPSEESQRGDIEKPQPKGYKPLSVKQRRDWNDMLDKMQEDGIAGHKDLDQPDKNVGASYIDKYKKENPDSTVSKDLIHHVAYEQQQLRSGESFAGMKPEETRVLRKQLSQDYLNRPGAPNTDSLGTSLS